MRYLLITLISLLMPLSSPALGDQWGGQSMVAELKKVLVKRPDASFAVHDPKRWHYTSRPNLAIAQQEHDDFVAILKAKGVEVIYHEQFTPKLADSIYVHDPALLTDHGAVLLRMGKELRRGEEQAIGQKFKQLGIPILGTLSEAATAEGGDMLWLDNNTLAVGRSFRTNQQGIDELRSMLADHNINVVSVDLPYDQGCDACLHLQSLISLVDDNLAVVYRELMPVAFIQELEQRGFQIIDAPKQEYLNMATNILTIKPRVLLTIEGNPQTHAKLRQAGCAVYTYKGDEMSLKAEGGATCLTRPLYRNV